MNVTINRAEMLSAIKRASAVAPADSPLDVLRGALLEADAAAGKLRHVIACDAADGDDRDFNGIADSSQRFVADILRIRLGTGVEDRADAEVICPALLGENGLFHGLRRNADDLVRAKLCTDIAGLHIALADMNAVRIHLSCDFHVIVDDERNMVCGTEFFQFQCLFHKVILVKIFFAELDKRCAALQSLFHLAVQCLAVQPAAVCHSI